MFKRFICWLTHLKSGYAMIYTYTLLPAGHIAYCRKCNNSFWMGRPRPYQPWKDQEWTQHFEDLTEAIAKTANATKKAQIKDTAYQQDEDR